MSSFFAATIALTQNDIKKVIAYSTASQLGYMVFICGLSAYNISMFHLVNHAFFKALLFLSAGSLIHALSGDQDMRKFSSLCKVLPYTYSMVLIGSFALAGLPFLSGFYSKDLILDIAFSKYAVGALFVYWFGTLTASLTAFYTIRLLLYIFYHSHRVTTTKYYIQNMHELPEVMGFSLAVLASGSIFSGFCIKDAFVGLGTIF
jgi:NADH:ubiquinone oxidoreductase subunit 5 (subunit L)/multisubunit Na+/H+ antiporter MnhA subunit